MRLLVTGGSGQVGTALAGALPAGWTVVAPPRSTLDLADTAALAAAVAAGGWDAVVNCAAYTAVDRAEADVVAAWRANALAPAALATATAAAGVPLVQLSTDYVFDGAADRPYREDDPIAPLGVYGASKAGGEQAVRTANPRHLILRTAWVVSATGHNFLRTMWRLGAERSELGIVADQHGCPTAAADIAAAIVTLLPRLAANEVTGTYHLVNAGETNWYGLAQHLFARAAQAGRRVPILHAITTADYPTPARRPANSRLDTARLHAMCGLRLRPWQEAVDEIADRLLEDMA